MKKVDLFKMALIAIVTLGFIGCNNDDDNNLPVITVPSELSVTSQGFYPEDVIVNNNYIFTSGGGDGSIRYFDLTKTNATAEVFAASEANFSQAWGLATYGDKLLAVLNNANFTDLPNSGPSKLVEYSITTQTKTNEWVLPNGTVGNSVRIANGKYYVGNLSSPQIIEINPSTNEMNANWATSTEWMSGIGGFVYNGTNAIYAASGGKLWYIPINNDGTSGVIEEVTLTGATQIAAADGMTWSNNGNLYFTSNDFSIPENVGIVYKVSFSDYKNATTSEEVVGLNDPSGVWFSNINNQDYLFISESQFGALVGNSAFEAPFKIKIIEL